MFFALDQRVCSHDHKHAQIAGSCHWRGKTIPLSQFAGNHPKQFAKAIVKGIITCNEGPMICPAYHIEDEEIQEPPVKKARIDHETSDPMKEDNIQDTTNWKEVFSRTSERTAQVWNPNLDQPTACRFPIRTKPNARTFSRCLEGW